MQRIVACFLLLLTSLVIADAAQAQRRMNQRQRGEAWPDMRDCKNTGWYVSPGVTYMGMNPFKKSLTLEETDAMTTKFEYSALGMPGLYVEAGRFHMTDRLKYVKYLDYGIAYKNLRGRERFDVVEEAATGTSETVASGRGKFADHFATAHLNFNHVVSLSTSHFLQNSLGVNADYGFIQNRGAEHAAQGLAGAPPAFLAAAHYKIGYGKRLSSKLLMIWTLETPIVNFLPFENGRSTLGYFNSRYRPLILSLRFMWFRKAGLEACPPVFNPADPQKIQEKLDKKRSR